ncbi:MAG: adenylate kinase [Bacteroidales bacterium]|nr:adenylate kinase [Bacteroidales bacterium]MBQ5980164.1 adenylate kinase [Bacteroidales bacterium]MBQ6185984.1 adenylate kinase [Bacteroidales bacterium]
MSNVRLHDKSFRPFIEYDAIEKAIDQVAEKINNDYQGCMDVPVLLCVLNGSILFTAELMKRLTFNCEIVCIKLSSYVGMKSTGEVRDIIGMTGNVKGKRVIIVEDIVDSGRTIANLTKMMEANGATETKICTMLFKPGCYKLDKKLDYVAMEIPDDFIVGFGLDYDGLGRNNKDIYVLDSTMKYYILFGPPGAGKGTQAASMAERFNLCHISTGDLLRGEMAKGSELGLKAKALIEAGELVPDEIVEGMIENKFNTVEGVSGFLLDGFPRTIAQAEALDKMLAKRDEKVSGVVSLMIPDEMIKERIRHRAAIEGRADDASDETISNRIKTYHEKTEPLVEFYKKAGSYNEIDGVGTIEEVRDRISALMETI